MPRQPVDTNLPSILLQPQAQPVDTFTAPGPSPLRDLAASLSVIDRPLRQFLDDRAEKHADEDRIRGEAAFYDNSAEDLAEGVRSGKIPAQYSPNFVKGWKNARGNVVGNQIKADFAVAFDEWEGKNSEDPEAYDQFLEDFLRKRIGTEDPEVLKGLMPHIREITANGNARYTAYRHERTYEGSLDANVAGALQDVDELNKEGLATEEGTNYPVVFQKIAEKRAAFVASGGRPEDFDKSMVDAMSVKVLTTRDPGLLAWFDQKIPGKDYTYGDSPYGAKVKAETISSLEVIARTADTEDRQRQKAADEKAKDDAHRAAVELLSQDPTAPIPAELLAAGSKVDPTFKVRIEEWRKNLGTGFTDPKRLRDVYSAILAGGGFKAVQEAASAGVFGRPEDLTAAYTFAKSFEDNEDRITETMRSAVAEQVLKDIDIRTKGKNDFTGDPISGMSNEGYEATFDFRRMVQEWVVKHPEASIQETEEAVTKIGKGIMDRFVLPEGAIEEDAARTYERAKDMPFDNPYTDGTAPTGGNDMQAPETEDRSETEDLLNGMSSEQRAAAEERAKAEGLTIEDWVDKYSSPPSSPAATPKASPISYQPEANAAPITPEVATAWLDQSLQEADEAGAPVKLTASAPDGQAARLLDLIGEYEAAGNYNAVFGNAGSKRDLGKLTLNQIIASQTAAKRRGVGSTAIGRYQFLVKTLKSLKQDLGLTGNERFTKELQDRLGVALLNRRGYQQFKAGKMSKRQFALRLSQEWASLPNPSTGRSFYAGDGFHGGTNVRTRDVYAALGVGI